MADVTAKSTPAVVVGSLQAYLVGGKFHFRDENFANPDVRVQLVLRKGDGTKENISCSTPMSKELRSGKLLPGHLLGFDVADVTNKKGEIIRMLILPEGNISEGFGADDVAVIEYKPKRKFLPEAFFAGV
jgi:hypothetical protein